MFMENHTIQDIEKTNAIEFQYSDNLIDLDLVPLTHLPTQVEMDDDVHEQSAVAETDILPHGILLMIMYY